MTGKYNTHRSPSSLTHRKAYFLVNFARADFVCSAPSYVVLYVTRGNEVTLLKTDYEGGLWPGVGIDCFLNIFFIGLFSFPGQCGKLLLAEPWVFETDL